MCRIQSQSRILKLLPKYALKCSRTITTTRRTATTAAASTGISSVNSLHPQYYHSPSSFNLRHRQQARLLHALSAGHAAGNGNGNELHRTRRLSSSSSLSVSSSTSSSYTGDGPKALYAQKVKQGLLQEDPRQLRILEDLQSTYDGIMEYKPPPVPEPLEDVDSESTSSSSSFFGRFFGWSATGKAGPPVPSIPEDVPKSLYLFGDVGCGKSMLMDLLYESLPESIGKRRVHFHAFMIDVHKRLHKIASEAEKTGISQKADAIVPVARELVKNYGRVLCFDEFQVTDIADAMILRRLLESMIGYGFVIVITSNRAPQDLYKNGIQRASFIPCIKLIESHFKILDLDSEIDYRKIPRALSKVYYDPITPENRLEFHKLFEGFTDGQKIINNDVLEVWGRELLVPKSTGVIGNNSNSSVSSSKKGADDAKQQEMATREGGKARVAMFTFDELCGHALSAADYLEIVKNFDTVFITDLPRLSLSEKDKARRFITFIDAAYDSKTKLLTLSHEPITQIFSDKSPAETGKSNESEEGYTPHQRAMMDDLGLDASTIGASSIFTGDEEIFAFARAVSRLSEMGTRQWAERSKGA